MRFPWGRLMSDAKKMDLDATLQQAKWIAGLDPEGNTVAAEYAAKVVELIALVRKAEAERDHAIGDGVRRVLLDGVRIAQAERDRDTASNERGRLFLLLATIAEATGRRAEFPEGQPITLDAVVEAVRQVVLARDAHRETGIRHSERADAAQAEARAEKERAERAEARLAGDLECGACGASLVCSCGCGDEVPPAARYAHDRAEAERDAATKRAERAEAEIAAAHEHACGRADEYRRTREALDEARGEAKRLREAAPKALLDVPTPKLAQLFYDGAGESCYSWEDVVAEHEDADEDDKGATQYTMICESVDLVRRCLVEKLNAALAPPQDGAKSNG